MTECAPFTHDQIKAVVYDIDGVLVDPVMSVVAQAMYWIEALNLSQEINGAQMLGRIYAANGKSGDPRKVMQEVLGITDEAWVQDEAKYRKLHLEAFEASKWAMALYPGAPELVQDTHAAKKAAAFTAREREFFNSNTIPELIPPDTNEPHGHFHLTVTNSDVTQAKPHPEGLEKIQSAFGLEANEMVVVGDSPTDMRAARAIGAHTIALLHPGSFASPKLLREERPEVMTTNFAQVRRLTLPPLP